MINLDSSTPLRVVIRIYPPPPLFFLKKKGVPNYARPLLYNSPAIINLGNFVSFHLENTCHPKIGHDD